MQCSASPFFLPIVPRLPRGLVCLLILSLLIQCGLAPAALPRPLLPLLTIATGRWRPCRLHAHATHRSRRRSVWWHGWHVLSRLLVRTLVLAVLLHTSGWLAHGTWTASLLVLPLLQTLAGGWTLTQPAAARGWLGHAGLRGLQRLYQLLFWCLLLCTLCQFVPHGPPSAGSLSGVFLLGTRAQPAGDEAEIRIETPAAQHYVVTLHGTFTFEWTARDSFEQWMLILFLRRFHRPGTTRPVLSLHHLATAFGVPSVSICYQVREVQAHSWHILSDRYRRQLHSSLPDAELSRQILQVWVPAFWLSAWEVRERLIQLGVIPGRDALDVEDLHVLAKHTGFNQVRDLLLERFDLQGGHLLAQEHWWLEHLLALNARLFEKLEHGERLTPQELIDSEPLRLNPSVKPTDSAPPLAAALHQVLFEPPTAPPVPTEPVRCTYCDSDQVAPKSKQPRLKTVLDEFGQAHVISVLRYYCHNPACRFKTFTHFPAGVLPHSRYPAQVRLLALEVYVGLLSTYRRSARMLDVKAPTVYGWLVSVSPAALALAAYLGVVRTSGVIGLDDKWVRVCSPSAVPQHGRRRRAVWRYAYFAIDMYSYDLLALELYPEHNDAAVRQFLLELKAKGIRPHVVVSDLDPAYGRMLPQIFPQAVHHECIFHAIQNAQRQLQQVYGKYYVEQVPAAATLHDRVVQLFDARTQKTVRHRFAELMALRESYVKQTPDVARVFDSLEAHFPKLVNAIESDLIPRTNNATERVIRRFDQHYQTMCGLDSFETARIYLRLFELVYRLTPLTDDSAPTKRGKCPLELAGYDLAALPLADFFNNLKLPTLMLPPAKLVPIP